MRVPERIDVERVRPLRAKQVDRRIREARAHRVRAEGAARAAHTAAAAGRPMSPDAAEMLRHRLTRIRMLANALLAALVSADPRKLLEVLDELAEQRDRLRAELNRLDN